MKTILLAVILLTASNATATPSDLHNKDKAVSNEASSSKSLFEVPKFILMNIGIEVRGTHFEAGSTYDISKLLNANDLIRENTLHLLLRHRDLYSVLVTREEIQ